MPRIFNYVENGLSYTVTVYESDGQIFADVTVNSGFMNVNAVYTGDSDFSGKSAGLSGPLNMNGGGSKFEGEKVQWDDAVEVSRPGLGHQDPDNPTFLQAGDTLTVSLNADSIEDVDFVGIRATSTSTPEGSIKGVSGNPVEEEDDDGDDDNDDEGDAIYSKVFFVYDQEADILGGFIFDADDLPDDAEGTFADYVDLMDSTSPNDIPLFNAVIFYQGEDLEEVFRLEGPFEDSDALITAYNEAIQAVDVEDLMIAFVGDEDAATEDEAETEDDMVEVI